MSDYFYSIEYNMKSMFNRFEYKDVFGIDINEFLAELANENNQ